ncbi:alpha/beta hydrolase [Altererythrobacter lutimaris]|uniref:Alpha/beta fold hydrolase n=1 Tax=Altererythrobacter lutimaris TaxID=2743979 RepID=A0A850H977_9SPHN|nr:alpha/beta hydrolase [Altererythrobacter lutimaris]NVE93501.1 alpha/beta fold hydrolase [Altererythrobacter lutimaris]
MECEYVTLPDGKQMHYRSMGEGPALVMLHPSPQNSEAMIPAMGAFSKAGTCIAFDTPGYGLSDPLAVSGTPSLGDYARRFVEAMDALGIEKACIYGAATGAQIAAEMGKLFPDRIAFVMLDSNGELTEQECADYIEAGYFADVTPQRDGAHLLTYWDMCRNLFYAFPWFSDAPEHRLGLDAPPVEMIHATLLRYLQAGENYADAYKPAFYAERVEHLEGMDVPATMTRWESSPVLALADALIARGLPDNVKLLRAGAGLEARYGVQLEALQSFLAGADLPTFKVPNAEETIGRFWCDTPAGRIHGERRAGEGDPVVMLHGAGGTAALFVERCQAQANGRSIVAFDLPCHGTSSDLSRGGPISVEAMADALFPALQGEGLAGADVITEGLGAAVAVALAERSGSGTLSIVEPERYSQSQVEAALAGGLPDLSPRMDGTHLIAAWSYARSGRLFTPPWDFSAAAQRSPALNTDPRDIHEECTAMLRVGTHWRELMALELQIDWNALVQRSGAEFVTLD